MNSNMENTLIKYLKTRIALILSASALLLNGCATTDFARDNDPPLFPEQELFKDANDAFLNWSIKGGDYWQPMHDEYFKLYGVDDNDKGKCSIKYGKGSEATKRCILRAMAQQGVAFDTSEERNQDTAFGRFQLILSMTKEWKLKPEPLKDYPAISDTSNDEFKKTIQSMSAIAWRMKRMLLADKGIITGDPICVTYTRSVPHFMKAKQYKEAATSAQSFLDYCLDPTNWIVSREQKFKHLGMLADAYSATKEFDKAVAAARERYYLLPTEEAANSYLKLLNPKIDQAEATNVTEYQSKIRAKMDRWLKLNPRPTDGENADFMAYDQRKMSLYKNALDATEKLGLKGYDPYLFNEYEFLVKSVSSHKGLIKAIKASDEYDRKRQADSDKSIGDFFDFVEGVQKLRR